MILALSICSLFDVNREVAGSESDIVRRGRCPRFDVAKSVDEVVALTEPTALSIYNKINTINGIINTTTSFNASFN